MLFTTYQGGTAAPDLSGECGEGKTPPQISRRKDQAGSLGLSPSRRLIRAGGRPIGHTPRREQKKRPYDHHRTFTVMANVNNKMLCLVIGFDTKFTESF